MTFVLIFCLGPVWYSKIGQQNAYFLIQVGCSPNKTQSKISHEITDNIKSTYVSRIEKGMKVISSQSKPVGPIMMIYIIIKVCCELKR